MGEYPTFIPETSDPDPDPTLIRNEKNNKYIYQVTKYSIFINHNFKFEFVDSGLYFGQDEYNFIYPLLKVVSGSCKNKVPEPAGQKSTDPI